MGSGREFADVEHFAPAIRTTFGPSRVLRGVVRLPGGTNKGVYRLSFDDGPSVLGYRWQRGEDYWPASFYDDGPFATTRSDGHTLFTTAHARLTTLDVRVPHLLYDDGHDTVLVEDVTGGTLEALLRSDATAGSGALAALRRMLDRMHADTSVGIGHAGDDFPGLTCERFALDRGLACLTEAVARVPRIAAAQADLERALRRRVDQITPRTTHRLIHGELGPDHVMIDDAGQPVLIDIEGITFFDVEWEHAFLELRFASNYEPLRAPGLDPQRLELYRLVHHLSLTAGPLMLLDGDFPHRDVMQRISDVNADRALAAISPR